MENDVIYDCAIAGAGPAGILSANRLGMNQPERKLLLLEKENHPGGRLGFDQAQSLDICFGFSSMSKTLYEFLSNTLNQDPDAVGIDELISDAGFSLGVLSAGQWFESSQAELFSHPGAKLINKSVDQKTWEKIVQVIFAGAEEEKDSAFQKALKLKQNDASLQVFKYLCSLVGVSDPNTASVAALRQRLLYFRQKTIAGNFSRVWQTLLDSASNLTQSYSNAIVEAKFSDGLWHIDTAKGVFQAKRLLVAQPSWQAMDWLEAEATPAAVLDQAWKTQPCSAVAIFAPKPKEVALPKLSLVPSEDCYLLCQSSTSVSYQCSLEHETSLDAPSVVKAIKKLRRARQKVHKRWPELGAEGQEEHIGLCPVLWAPAVSFVEKRFQDKVEAKAIQSATLAFCGDGYDASADPDTNLIQSVLAATAALF